MSQEKINQLKAIAKEVDSTLSSEKQIELLSKGFDLFSDETKRLGETYQHLHQQFRSVNVKLEETNERLQHKVEELHVLTNYLDNILSHMTQGLLFIDQEGYITTYNTAAETILEIPREKILFQPYSTHFKDDFFGFSINFALKEKALKKTNSLTLHFPKGKEKEIEVDTTLIPFNEGSLKPFDFTHGIIILIRDITELKKLQIASSRADRMKALGEMAAQVAHEIRNPLGGIKGFASLLERDLNDETPLKYVHYIIEGANTLDRLVNDILTYTREVKLNLEPCNVLKLIDELIISLKAENVLKDNIKCEFLIEQKIELFLDISLMKSAFRNLIMNAIEAMPNGGKLTFKLNKTQGKNCITITDTGMGIEEEHMKKLFSPFFTTKTTGNGLGLAEVHKVIQAHGGEINVSSTPKIGTSFMIWLCQ